MMHQPDYYQILGVSKDSSPEDIKKSYRKLAMQYHPDRNPGDAEAEKKFKEIADAYSVLSDPEKKRQHDNPDPFSNFGGNFRSHRFHNDFEGEMFGDIFSQFFSRSEPGFHHFRNKGGDVRLHVSITTKECYEGAVKTIRYKRSVRGKMVEEVKSVQLPKNADGSMTLRMRGAGHGPPTGEDRADLFGDLLLTVTITPDTFTKDDLNLVYEMTVDPVDLLIGKEHIIPHYDGELRVTLPAGTNPSFYLRVQGKGFRLSEGEVGDLMIRLVLTNEVQLPEDLKEQLRQYKQQAPA